MAVLRAPSSVARSRARSTPFIQPLRAGPFQLSPSRALKTASFAPDAIQQLQRHRSSAWQLRAHAVHEPPLSESPSTSAPAAAAAADGAFDARAAWTPGEVYDVQSPAEFKAFAQQLSHTRPVLLMCKAKACRPCKVFARTYARYAAANPEVAFLAVVGDASPELRRMMVLLKIASTPSFVLFRDEALVHQHAGRSDAKLEAALDVAYGTLPPSAEPSARAAARAAGVTVVDDD